MKEKLPNIRSRNANIGSKTFGKVLDYDGKWKNPEDLLPLK